MAIETFFAEISGSADGLIAAAGEGTAAADELESSVARTSGGMALVGSSAAEHIGGTATKNVGLLDKAFGAVFHSIGSVVGSMVSMVGQTAGIGAIFGGAAGLAEGVKLAQDYNEQMSAIAASYAAQGKAMPTKEIDAMLASSTKLGFAESASLPALKEMAQAGIPIAAQSTLMSTAADLARAKSIDLATALDDLLKASEGSGRGLQDLGINLPAVVPKAAALASATAALHKAQQQYQLDLQTYGPASTKTIAANQALSAATMKVSTDTKAMSDHFSQLPSVLTQVEQHVGHAAQQYAAENPFSVMGADMQAIARAAGEELLPGLDNIANWITNHEGQIESFTVNAVGALGTAASDAGGFIANDLYPPVKDVIGFVVDNASVFEDAVGALTALYVGKKAIGIGQNVFNDVKGLVSGLSSVPGLIGKITGVGSSVSSKVAPVDVYVVNEGFGGVGGGASGDAEGATGAAALIGGLMPAAVTAAAAVVVGMDWSLITNKGKGTNVLNPGSRPELDPGAARFGSLVISGQQNVESNLSQLNEDTLKADRYFQTTINPDLSSLGKAFGLAQLNAYGLAHDIGGVDNQVLGMVSAFASAKGDANAVASNLGRQAAQLGRENFSSSVAPGAPGGGTINGDVHITVPGTSNPQATATAVRNSLLSLVGRGAIPRAFP